MGQAKRVWPAYLPVDGSWSDWVNGSLLQNVRPHVWYFAIRDCKQALPSAVHIDFEFHALQEGGSEFSVELYGTQAVAAAKIVLGTAFFPWFCRAAFQSRQSAGSLHPVILVLGIAAVTQYVGYACHWCHLSVYQANGSGVRLLDVLGELCSMLSQILLTSLSIFLAKGYTILPAEQVSLRSSLPALAVIVATHLAITGAAKTRDDASFKFHENEGACGIVLVSLRLALYAWFCLSMQRTYAGAPLKIQPFVTRFSIASSLHYLSYPLLFSIAPLVAPYLRHKFMLAGLFSMQAWSLGWYTQMFLTRGKYFQVSSLGGNILPTPQGSKKRPRLFSRERAQPWGKAD
uniref:GPR180/TMEM145 transmembrane domain-containing protein n=1 Tax=Alexandrium catenella TaxID=2925 RepID=A0A7S1L7D0_ALECA|mmetsp:Transcript_107661/g.286574  ORF Transcript_107661/g.286574 Transcript_107661/m.286574 type:complete len:346 (+) Transcript_107661:1-1038(+)